MATSAEHFSPHEKPGESKPLLLLPGNSSKSWILEVEQVLKPLFAETRVQQYRHHETGEALINLDHELKVLEHHVQGFQDYVIFAKSAGTVLTTRAVHEKIITPDRCIFLGFPLHWARDHDFHLDRWLEGYAVPTLFIQQTEDKYLHYAELEQVLNERQVRNQSLHEIPGSDHNYTNLNLIKSLIEQYLS